MSALNRLDAHPMQSAPEMRLIAASLYYRFASLSGSSDAQNLRELSRIANREVLANQTNGFFAGGAYVGLANLAETHDERLGFLQSAVRADPDDMSLPELLAMHLSQRTDDASFAEAAEHMRRAYTLRARRDPDGTDLKRWHVGASVVGYYTRSEQPDKAAEFLEQLRRDSRMDVLAEDVLSVRFANDSRHAEQALRTACSRYIVGLFGADTCMNGITTLVDAVDTAAPDEHHLRLASVATEGMADLITGQDEETYREIFVPILRRWVDYGVHTASVFMRYSNNVGDAELSLWALENAVELEPDNGQYRYWLGIRYLDLGRYDEALEQLQRARPDMREGFDFELLDQRIRHAEAGSLANQPR